MYKAKISEATWVFRRAQPESDSPLCLWGVHAGLTRHCGKEGRCASTFSKAFVPGRHPLLDPAASLIFGNYRFHGCLMRGCLGLSAKYSAVRIVPGSCFTSLLSTGWRVVSSLYIQGKHCCPLASYLFRFLKRNGMCHKSSWDLLAKICFRLKAHCLPYCVSSATVSCLPWPLQDPASPTKMFLWFFGFFVN